jgi:uncharacterized Fe-S cluster-containing protein
MISDRHYGKAKEQVEHGGVIDIIESRTVRLIRPSPNEKVVEATVVADKARGQLDAE